MTSPNSTTNNGGEITMTMSKAFDPETLETKRGKLRDQVLGARRDAAERCLEAYETAMEQIASYQEQAANQTEVDWIATACKAQATFTREMAKRQVSVGREFLK
jgi:hypothetical protein